MILQQITRIRLVATVSNKITEIGNILTRFSGGNDLYSLNQAESLAHPSQDLVTVLEQARSYSQSTGGCFDITVEPVLKMLQNYLEGQPFPTDAQFNSALSLIDYQDVDVSSNLVTLEKPGMGVTLDGIAHRLHPRQVNRNSEIKWNQIGIHQFWRNA